ncbi:MAG: class I SAM-dependent methyltransferase [Acidobacteria bacterium]|nr:class I SAM-dependent methyltransferase [Acidobacteriota bacterium]
MEEKFIEAVGRNQHRFGLALEPSQIEKLAGYCRLVRQQNDLLHLVAPCSEEEFAVRHILESLTLLEYLPAGAAFADVGSGAGLPALPCLLVREDLTGVLIESKLKKGRFLEETISGLGLGGRVRLINRQFEEISRPEVGFVTCRALDKFTQKLPRLLKWSKKSVLLFFGGNALRAELEKNRLKFGEKLMPMSEQRFLFIAENRAR